MKITQTLLSAVVLTNNEEQNLKQCLENLKFCNEIIVIDDNSIDKTRQIAKNFGAKVYKHLLNNNFSAQRNFALKKASFEWVLFVDADERVSKELRDEIVDTLSTNRNISGYIIKRADYLWGRKIRFGEVGLFGTGYLLRLAKKDSGVWKRRIHERWEIDGVVGKLNSELLHYPHQTVWEFLGDVSNRARLHAESLKGEGKRGLFAKVIFWPIGKFVYNFFVRLGVLDGVEGFILAVVMSLHSFISWAYLWQEGSNYE